MADNITTTLELNAKDNTKAAFAKLNSNIKKTTKSTTEFDNRVRNLQGTLLRATTVFAAFTAGAVAFTSSIGAARRFGQQMAEVSTLVDDAETSMTGYRKAVDNLVMTYGGTFQAASKALYDTISAGNGSVAAATKVLNAANTAAIAGVSDIATSVDALTTVLNSYGWEANQSTKVTDILFKTVKAGKTTLGEMAPVLGQVTATAAAMNVTFAEVGAVIATATSKGIFTSQAITGLKAALSNVVKPTKDAAQMAEFLGIQFDAATLKSQGFTRFIQNILTAASEKGISSTDAMEKLFGSVEALNTMFALVANNGAVYNSKLQEIQMSTGATQEAFTKMTKTFAFQWDAFIGKIKVGTRNLGELLTNSLTGPLTWINENFDIWVYEIGRGFAQVSDAAKWLGREVQKAFQPWKNGLMWIIDEVVLPIKQAFYDLWIDVVHKSYVPDLVIEVQEWFGKLASLPGWLMSFVVTPLKFAFLGLTHAVSAAIDIVNLSLIPLGISIPDLGKKIRDAMDISIPGNLLDSLSLSKPITETDMAMNQLNETFKSTFGWFAAGAFQDIIYKVLGVAIIPAVIRLVGRLTDKFKAFVGQQRAARAMAVEAQTAQMQALTNQEKFLKNVQKYDTEYGRVLQGIVDQGGTRSALAQFFGGSDEWKLAQARAKDAIDKAESQARGLKIGKDGKAKGSVLSRYLYGDLTEKQIKKRLARVEKRLRNKRKNLINQLSVKVLYKELRTL